MAVIRAEFFCCNREEYFSHFNCAVINDNCIFAAAKDKNLSKIVNGRVAQLDRASAF